MLVGRSLYGWGTASLKKELLKQGVNQAVEDAWKYWDEGNCPLAAVIAHWGSDLATGKSHWNMRRSQFWMTARDVVNGLALPSTEYPSWFSRLHWTNLYKVNPARTGNPGGPLVEAQHELCKDILRSEIMLLQPKRVLFLTGWDWAKPFLNHWHAGVERLTEEPWVQARGSLPSDMG
jgi:hypothetical protein